ncbi:MAG: Na+/H+ antiporter subunit E [Candidatus Omnitrophota bacterium]|nr:Na+/H+ antiporter subunit E [Candidatus Omnitrophota bacterium]
MISSVIYFVLWFLIWSALRRPRDAQDLVLGILVSLFITFMTKDLAAQTGEKKDLKRYSPLAMLKRAAWFLYYIFVFLWECLKANVDVAYRVLHPDMPIRPGTVKVKVGLRSDIGLTFLANSITLTPGTTSVDIDKEKGYLYVHWIYVRGDYASGIVKLPVVEKFESILKRIFE